MIVQHNIMAVNSHRQLSANNVNLSRNLEKLSSGYRINKAADDAAGLAISEKMRAQITGLNRAVLNAQDGASLIQTAEGALTEVHSMLNRMVELSTQSANGTIQADDRQKIESELNALKGEIDRISKATNFNGINLLDGSLSTTGASGSVAATVTGLDLTDVAATKATSTLTAVAALAAGAITDGVTHTLSFGLSDGTSANITLTGNADGNLVLADGTVFTVAAAGEATATEIGDAFAKAINAQYGDTFKVTNAAGALTFTSKDAGAAAPVVNSASVIDAAGARTPLTPTVVKGVDAYQTGTPAAGDVFTVNGLQFSLVADNAALEALDSSIIGAVDADTLVALINQHTGLAATNAAGVISFKANETATQGGGLTMQVGDTAQAFNKITVSVDNMSSQGLGIANISMATQELASAALDKIKAAIEKVSVNRGNLGALQNRLDHTINNLGVTSENMTAAESRIRDVDMAKEMMAFTKNNVLAQAAQAMLAQANQQPQQVLQLLR